MYWVTQMSQEGYSREADEGDMCCRNERSWENLEKFRMNLSWLWEVKFALWEDWYLRSICMIWISTPNAILFENSDGYCEERKVYGTCRAAKGMLSVKSETDISIKGLKIKIRHQVMKLNLLPVILATIWI